MFKKLVFSLVFFALSTSLSAIGKSIQFINKTSWHLIIWQPHSQELLNRNGFQERDGVRYTLGSYRSLELNRSFPLFIKNMKAWHKVDISDDGYDVIEAFCMGDTILVNGVSNKNPLSPSPLLSISI